MSRWLTRVQWEQVSMESKGLCASVNRRGDPGCGNTWSPASACAALSSVCITDLGAVWFVPPTSLAKNLAAYNYLVVVCFIVKILVANLIHLTSLTYFWQIFDKMRAKESLTKKLASQILLTFGRIVFGTNQTAPWSLCPSARGA